MTRYLFAAVGLGLVLCACAPANGGEPAAAAPATTAPTTGGMEGVEEQPTFDPNDPHQERYTGAITDAQCPGMSNDKRLVDMLEDGDLDAFAFYNGFDGNTEYKLEGSGPGDIMHDIAEDVPNGGEHKFVRYMCDTQWIPSGQSGGEGFNTTTAAYWGLNACFADSWTPTAEDKEMFPPGFLDGMDFDSQIAAQRSYGANEIADTLEALQDAAHRFICP